MSTGVARRPMCESTWEVGLAVYLQKMTNESDLETAGLPSVGALVSMCPRLFDTVVATVSVAGFAGVGEAPLRRLRPAAVNVRYNWPIIEGVAKYEQALTVVRDDMKFLDADNKSWMLSKAMEKVWPWA